MFSDTERAPTIADVMGAACGRWKEILPALGVPANVLKNEHGPCPGCGGKDRFRFDDLDGCGTFYCSGGGSKDTHGDGLDLLEHAGVAQTLRDALRMVADHLGLNASQREPRSPTEAPESIEYKYLGADGEPQYTVIRKQFSDGDKKFSQKTIRGLKPTEDPDFVPLPYLLPELLARSDATVHVVEGEKCADLLSKLGLVATCNSGGAGNWKPELNGYFKDRDVIILPDNDAPGERHARKVIDELLHIAASVRVCKLPGLPPKGDVCDFFDAGNGLKELATELSFAEHADDGLGQRLVDLQHEVIDIPEPVHTHIPHGLSLIVGAPKAGKSTFMEWVAFEISKSAPVLYLALEYSKPMAQQRFKWMPSSCDIRLYYQGEVPRMGEGGDEYLDRLLGKLKPKLTVIDTLAYFKKLSAEKGYESETVAMSEIKELFARHDLSCVCIHHSRKGNVNDDPNDPFQRILGSTALGAVPDNLMVLESKEEQTVLHTKGRLVTTSKKYFNYSANCFELDTSPGAGLAGVADIQQAIVNYLDDGPATQKEIGEALALKQGHVSNYIKKLVDKDLVRKNGRGQPVELIRSNAVLFT